MSSIAVNEITKADGSGSLTVPAETGTVVIKDGSNNVTLNDITAGGIYLGGSGAANYLDDYEEGTFTATCNNGVTLNSGYDLAQYIKVGNMVTVSGQVQINNSNSSSDFVINNLPFTSASMSEGAGLTAGAVRLYVNDMDSDAKYVICEVGGNSTRLEFSQVRDNGVSSALNASTNGYIMFGITYRSA